MSAWSGAAGSPAGGGIRSTMASSSSGTPSPVLAEMCRMSDAGEPEDLSRSPSAHRSGSAAGRSILLRTATISRSCSRAW